MKKIIILMAMLLAGTGLSQTGYAACLIENIGACKADIGIGNEGNIRDRMVPDNLKKMTRPNSSMEIRQQTVEPQLPSTINTEPLRTENAPGYDANCQFGNCMNTPTTNETAQ